MRVIYCTMAVWKPITNLRSRIIHHPPVAMFFMCLLVLAGAFISIGLYSQNHDIKNPDINMVIILLCFVFFHLKKNPPEIWCPRLSFFVDDPFLLFVCVFFQDWNQMLGSLAYLKFCTQLNDTDLLNNKPDMNSPPLLDHADVLINNTQQESEVISMFLLVPLMHVGDYLDHNSISATLLGSQLGLKGMYTGSNKMQTDGMC